MSGASLVVPRSGRPERAHRPACRMPLLAAMADAAVRLVRRGSQLALEGEAQTAGRPTSVCPRRGSLRLNDVPPSRLSDRHRRAESDASYCVGEAGAAREDAVALPIAGAAVAMRPGC